MIADSTGGRVRQALERFEASLRREFPSLADKTLAWMAGPSPGARPGDRLRHPRFFPIFEVPCWAEQSSCGALDAALQSDLAYSTLNGYAFARLVDDVMDAHDPAAREVLPAGALFVEEFQRPYRERFAGDHPFWEVFRAEWLRSFDVAHREAELTVLDRRAFEELSARKLCALKVPVAAVLFAQGKPERQADWSRFLDCLGRFHQMADDLADFRDDLGAGRATFLLSEGAARKAPGESVAGWIVREGFGWAVAALEEWLTELASAARDLGSPEAECYVQRRETMLRTQVEELTPALCTLAVIASGMDAGKN